MRTTIVPVDCFTTVVLWIFLKCEGDYTRLSRLSLFMYEVLVTSQSSGVVNSPYG